MDAFTMAEDMLPGIHLTPEQRAQLRALNQEYYTRLFALSRAPGPEQAPEPGGPHLSREPTPAEAGELRAMLVAGIREMLTDTQRRACGLDR
jgi:hypothetical protein